ncbi:PilW family protein [Vibrio fluvialis]|uniref:PilW family protein n=1 Tax=Vibrio fluvialis TaxID=676 RepID=UPI0015597652|nr:pilus assembly protein PilW [Vibrio fluvialis]
MVIQRARKKLRGALLIEFMIASLVGTMALAIIGSVFISSQRSAAQRSQEILLLQNITNVMQGMKEEMYQAGFDDINRTSVLLSGASSVVYTQSFPSVVGFVYRVESAGAAAYRHVVYRQDSTALKLCEKMRAAPLTPASAADSIVGDSCYSLFDPRQISVTAFSTDTDALSGGLVSGAMTTVAITAALTNRPSVTQSLSFQIQSRNWQ